MTKLSKIRVRIEELMSDNKIRTATQICKELQINRTGSVDTQITALVTDKVLSIVASQKVGTHKANMLQATQPTANTGKNPFDYQNYESQVNWVDTSDKYSANLRYV